MFTTLKRSRMISQLEVDNGKGGKPEPAKVRSIQSVTGRVVVLCFTTWYFGYVFTEISPMGPEILSKAFGNSMANQNYLGPCYGLIPLGAALGVIINYYVMNLLSRRVYLVLLNVFNLVVTGCLQIGNIYTLYVFRFLQGVLVGNFMTLVPTYIGEITPKELGSKFGIYPQISVVLGVLTAFVLGVIFTSCFNLQYSPAPPLADWQVQVFWRVMLIVPVLPSLLQLLFIAVGFIPESPYSLIIKNRREQARDVLSIFYQEQYVEQILQQKQSAIFNSKTQSHQNQVQWTCKGYFLGFQLSIFQVLTGIASFVTQAGHVMAVSLNVPIIGLYTPVLITISQLVGTFMSIPLLKYLEWRKITIIGGFTLAFFDAVIGLLFFLFHQIDWQYSMILSTICIMAFMFTFGVTLGSSVWPYIGYMMPNGAVTGALVLNWILAGLSIMSFSFVTSAMGSPWVMLWIYFGVTLVLSIVNAVMLIDIRGLSVKKTQLQLQ